MEHLKAYASSSSDSDSPPKRPKKLRPRSQQSVYSITPIPPTPPSELHSIPNALSAASSSDYGGRKRAFPHVDGNFPVHLRIPVNVTQAARVILEDMLGRASELAPELRGIDEDIIISCTKRRELSRSTASSNIEIAKEYHISLSRTVPIRVHQIETLVPMLRHKFQHQTRYWIEFGRWEVFVNDEHTRTFLALEIVTAGVVEVRRQITNVSDAFRKHGLPPFYQPARPHISVAYAVGDISEELEPVAAHLNELSGNGSRGLSKVLWSHLFGRLDCKIGQQTYPIWVATTPSHT